VYRLFVLLGKAGLKIIDAGKYVLVLDHIGELQYKLFISDKCYDIKQIIGLIKWKRENCSKSRKEFLYTCFEN